MVKLSKNRTLHFIGIGGSGMSAIARILLEPGYKVTGSDIRESVNTLRLKDFGARIYYHHDPLNLREADMVIVSSAISPDNPELKTAYENEIPIVKRAEMLSILMNQFPKKISVTGTHGKTTTTSMITKMLSVANQYPTYLIGADMNDFEGNAALGQGPYFIAESDESDGSFLCLYPNISVITNIEAEHMDYYKSVNDIVDHFDTFIARTIKDEGYIILNQDDPYLCKFKDQYAPECMITFGIESDALIKATNIKSEKTGKSRYLPVGLSCEIP